MLIETVFNGKLFNLSKLKILMRKKLQYLVYITVKLYKSIKDETFTVFQHGFNISLGYVTTAVK